MGRAHRANRKPFVKQPGFGLVQMVTELAEVQNEALKLQRVWREKKDGFVV